VLFRSYSADPKKNKKAVRYDHLTSRQLIGIVGKAQLVAGLNTVLDIIAARVVERSKIPLVVLDGTDPENLRSAVISGRYTGTIVSDKKACPLPL
jgi:uridylate kinase